MTVSSPFTKYPPFYETDLNVMILKKKLDWL